MKKLIILIVIIVLVGGLGFWGPLNHGHFEHHSVMEELSHHDMNTTEVVRGTNKLNTFDSTEFVQVHSSDPEIKNFFAQSRTSEIISFPCQNCHTTPLKEMPRPAGSTANAHWDIELNHADRAVMSCVSCHHEDNMNLLSSLQGESIAFDRSFELCGQCHFTQYNDWQGGAHGKNLSGWNSPRVVQTCVACHDPHDPSIKSRWPSRLISTAPRKTEK